MRAKFHVKVSGLSFRLSGVRRLVAGNRWQVESGRRQVAGMTSHHASRLTPHRLGLFPFLVALLLLLLISPRVLAQDPISPVEAMLAANQAYEKGVSRLHASIRTNATPVTLVDLGSVNGTRINGQKIPPSQPAPLSHGDIITLGKLKLQMIIRR